MYSTIAALFINLSYHSVISNMTDIVSTIAASANSDGISGAVTVVTTYLLSLLSTVAVLEDSTTSEEEYREYQLLWYGVLLRGIGIVALIAIG
jgi:hypothetical protein